VRILFSSVVFYPSIGGIEAVSAILAERFQALGHDVVLITRTPWAGVDHQPYDVVRNPGPKRLVNLVAQADIVFHNNIGLRTAWPLLFIHKPWVVAHHTWIPRAGPGSMSGRLKHAILRHARHIAVSKAVARSITVPSTVIPNPFADDLFRLLPDVERLRDLIFVGRLVSDKGVTILLDALEHLRRRNLKLTLSIVGGGPEEAALRDQVTRLDLGGQVDFLGQRTGHDLVRLLNAHRFLVVPSVWEEPFGIVALEAIACGCIPVVSRSGGLPDAIGPCGAVFAKGDSRALGNCLYDLSSNDAALQGYREHASEHLALHSRDIVARKYLTVLEHARRPL